MVVSRWRTNNTGSSRARRLSVLFTLMLACVVFASCAYITAPARIVGSGVCLPAPPHTAGDLQAAFDTRGPRWAGADGAIQTLLPDGRMLWSFGDTFMSQVSPTGKLINFEEPGMVANTFIIQSGACFTYLIGGHPGNPRAAFTPLSPATQYWPVGGYYDPHRNQVVVDALEVNRGSVQFVAVAELYLSWPNLTPVGSARLPFPIGGSHPAYGESTYVENGQVYLYARVGHSHYVARKSLGLPASGPWSYWTNTGWSPTPADARPMTVTGVEPLSPINVIKYNGRYLGSTKIWDVATDDVSQWSASSPTGPWAYEGRIATTPSTNRYTYGGRIVMLPGNVPVVTYSYHSNIPDQIRNNVLLYGVKVVPYVAPSRSSTTAIPALPDSLPTSSPTILGSHSSSR